MAPADLYQFLCSDKGEMIKALVAENGLSSTVLRFANDAEARAIAIQWDLQLRAASKIPELLNREPHWLIPTKQSLEQSSSDTLALYKARETSGSILADLTGGMGVDVWAHASLGKKVYYIERDAFLAEFARWNFQNHPNVEVLHTDAQTWLETGTSCDVIYIDPDRRVQSKRSFLLEDASPNVLELWPKLSLASEKICLKLSPMVDLHYLIRAFSEASNIEILSLDNDVKEVLLQFPGLGRIRAVHFDDKRKICELETNQKDLNEVPPVGKIGDYIYEPYPAMMKSGCWRTMAVKYGVVQLDTQSHIFTSSELVADFPGKIWKVEETAKPGTKNLIDPEGMHIICRNFPLRAPDLRKKYRIKEGTTLLLATNILGAKTWVRAKRVCSEDL
jgi:hypothetical protein